MSPHAATFRQALRALDTLMGFTHRYMPIEYGRSDNELGRTWHKTGDPDALIALVEHWESVRDEEIRLLLPEPKPRHGPMGASILWARTQGPAQTKRAFGFRPLPTMVLRAGASTRLLIWALEGFLPYEQVEDFNRRIAYRLGAKQCDGLPERLRIPAPGSCLRIGRARPIPVVVSRLEPELHDAERLAGRLRRPPEVDPSKWGNRKAA